MKKITTLLLGVLAFGFISAAQAQTPIRITGSTAFRSNSLTAILNIMDPGFTYGYTGTTYTSSKAAIIKGSVGGSAVTIKTSWSGSEAGNQTVSYGDNATPINVLFLPDSSTTSTGGTPGLLDPTVAGNPNSPEVPDVALSDTFQSTSFFFGTYFGKFYPTLNSSNTTPGLPVGQIVGVVQFKWIAGRSIPAGLSNMTSQLARDLYASGTAALALWTGSPADHGTKVFAIGRDFDSGTRLTAFAETGVGAKAVVKQYQPQNAANAVITTAGGTIDHLTLWPAGSVNGIPYGPGNGGYSSGGQLAAAINNFPPANSLLVGYAGISDADANITNIATTGATELSYNGVTLGKPENPLLIQEGAYTFWGYEHLYYRDSTAGVVKTVADTLALDIFNTDAPLPHYSDMQVTRSTDGATVVQKYL
ncbi:MAG: hypothetical protein H0X40_03735 [Chthoniobacterales bacterium]|nr:hypothetical protein [Chthoniobacterales bacterium]